MAERWRMKDWLSRTGPTPFLAYCILAAFGTYFCMYAFRKPFTAGEFKETVWLGIGLKTLLVSSQVAGYTLSKFIGIKVISEMPPRYRAVSILVLIAVAEVALLLFALTPAPWNAVWLFVNGLPLGMVFGLVIGYLEGRQLTEALSAGLCASFIVSSGFVKSVGRTLILDYGVDETWMPFLTGLIFVIPLLFFVAMLSQIPPPNERDEQSRSKRVPMMRTERRRFFYKHLVGLSALLLIYILLTIVRSFRDDFGVEIWQDLGVDDEPAVFAKSEFWVAVGVTAINGMIIWIKDNRAAFLASIGMLGGGFVLVALTLMGQATQSLSPMVFMVLLGLGMYIPYVIFHTTVFERMLAAFKESGTIGYLMYLADAIGYLGYVGVMVAGNLVTDDLDFLGLLIWISGLVSVVSIGLTLFLLLYYRKRLRGSAVA